MFTNRTPWVILLLVWMAGSTWWHVCKIKLLCADSPPSTKTSFPTTPPTAAAVPKPLLRVRDGSQFQFTAAGNFSFARSGAVATRTGVGALLDSLASYLKANTGKALVISGYYSNVEQNSTPFANLGLARANGIKKSLKQLGLPDSLLITNSINKEDLTFSARGDSIYGGLSFNFSTLDSTATTLPATATATSLSVLTEPVTEKELAEKETFTSLFEPIDLYFALGEANYIKTEETSKFFEEAATYLTRNKNKKLVLTGYTDNTGPDAVNLQLSRDRANSVKARLRKLGIASEQIQIEAMGKADPKADNSTLSGRKTNRRVRAVVR